MNSDSKIMLVEDDESLGYLLSEYLKIKGFEIEWVNRGKLALDKLEKENFSLVILDLMLPDIDGFEIAGKMKETAPEIPFLFLTARSLKIDVLKGFSLGAVDYIKNQSMKRSWLHGYRQFFPAYSQQNCRSRNF